MKDSQVYELLSLTLMTHCESACGRNQLCCDDRCPTARLKRQFEDRAAYARREEYVADQLAPREDVESRG